MLLNLSQKIKAINNLIYLSILLLLFGLTVPAIAEDHVRVYLSDQNGNPVTNATMQMQVEPGSVLIGQDDESQTLSFRHTGSGEYRSEEPPLSGSHYQVELEVDAPGYAGQTFLLTESGRVRPEYRFTLEADGTREDDQQLSEDEDRVQSQTIMEPAPEPLTETPLEHEIISSSEYQDYRYRDPFQIAGLNNQGDQFSIDQEKQQIHFLLEEAGPTQSRTKDLYLNIEGLEDYTVELQRGRQEQTEMISEMVFMSMPDNSLFSRIRGAIDQVESGVKQEVYHLGSNSWRGEYFITITYSGEVEQEVLLSLIAQNPDELSSSIEELGRFLFAAPIAIQHLLGESELTHMSFVNYLIDIPSEIVTADEPSEHETESPPSVGDWPRDTETEVVEVTNPETGQVWMDRNLGASRAATSSTDEQAYGELYQWGRPADGHQKRDSETTSTLSDSDQPGHDNFILAPDNPYDWRSPQNDDLWQGVDGVNNPCPPGYRLPTAAEWQEEIETWDSEDASGAFGSPLKLPKAGRRGGSSGSLIDVGSFGDYWSSSVSGSNVWFLLFYSSHAGMYSYFRALGGSVRCLED